jgi:hypothetical protein
MIPLLSEKYLRREKKLRKQKNRMRIHAKHLGEIYQQIWAKRALVSALDLKENK